MINSLIKVKAENFKTKEIIDVFFPDSIIKKFCGYVDYFLDKNTYILVFHECEKTKKIRPGHEGYHYLIDGKLFNTTITNSYKYMLDSIEKKEKGEIRWPKLPMFTKGFKIKEHQEEDEEHGTIQTKNKLYEEMNIFDFI